MDEFHSLELVYAKHFGLQEKETSADKEMLDHLSIVETNLVQKYKNKELNEKMDKMKKSLASGVESCD